MYKRLKKLRNELEMTQQEFADVLGTARGNISAYEVGKMHPVMLLSLLYVRQTSQKEESMRPGYALVKGKCLSKRPVTNRSPLLSAAF